MTAVNQDIGDPLSLRCNVSTVKGITSNVSIVWMTNGKKLKQEDGNVKENKTNYTYGYNNYSKNLTANDNNMVYHCQVIINTSRSSISGTGSVTLNLGEYNVIIATVVINCNNWCQCEYSDVKKLSSV